MQKEDPLSQTPQRRRAKFGGTRLSLADTIGEPGPHIMDQEIRIKIHILIAKRGDA